MADQGVVLVGWREFVRDLRRTAPEMAKELRRANRAIANEVRDEARTNARAHSEQYAKAATGIQSRAFPDAAQLVLNNRRKPWLFGAEFGAFAYKQFRTWTGNQFVAFKDDGPGYAALPTLRDNTDEIGDEYFDRIFDAMSTAFPKRGL